MNIGQLVQKPVVKKLNKGTDVLIDNHTLLGVEVEVENYLKDMDYKSPQSAYWTAKEDLSLRNNGQELVFNEPLNGADAVEAVTWLCDQAQIKGWKVSKLTGIHVHLDVRDMEVIEFRNFCTTFALVEPAIYHWIGRKRYENMFCLPWYMADSDVVSINKAMDVSVDNPAQALGFLKGLSKYSGLNVGAAAKFGTAEFRMMETSFDKDRLITWLNIILSLKKYACGEGLTPEGIVARLTVVKPYGLLMDVFGAKLGGKLWYEGYEKDAIGLGMVTADWFLKNTKDLQLQGKSTEEKFSIARKNAMGAKDTGSHKGLEKWASRFSVPRTGTKRPPRVYADVDQLLMKLPKKAIVMPQYDAPQPVDWGQFVVANDPPEVDMDLGENP